jgi:hypothetical protein
MSEYSLQDQAYLHKELIIELNQQTLLTFLSLVNYGKLKLTC